MSEQVIEETAYFALLPEDYEDLSLNQAETLRWVKEAMWRLEYYHGKGKGKDEGTISD